MVGVGVEVMDSGRALSVWKLACLLEDSRIIFQLIQHVDEFSNIMLLSENYLVWGSPFPHYPIPIHSGIWA